MRTSHLVAPGVVVALVALGACGQRETCQQPAHPALTAQALGQPCTGTADCASGLSCLRSSAGPDEAPAWGGLRTCSVRCAAAACDAGTTCVTIAVENDGGVERLCLPTCQADADCQQGTAAGRCATDAGVRFCERLDCWDDAQCPAGYACESSINICCPAGAMCIRGGLQVGYCRKP